MLLAYELAVLKPRNAMDSDRARDHLKAVGLLEADEWEKMVPGDRHTTVFFWILIGLGRSALPVWLGAETWELLAPWDPFLRMQDFTIGLIDTSSLVYFVSLTGLFLAASVVIVETERCA